MSRLLDTRGRLAEGPLYRRQVEIVTPVLAGLVVIACVVGMIGLLVDRPLFAGMRASPSGLRAATVIASLAVGLALLGVRKVLPMPRSVQGLLPVVAIAAAATSLQHWIPELRRASEQMLPDGVEPFEMATLPAVAVLLLAIGVHGLRHGGVWVAVTDACAAGALGISAFILFSVGVGTPGITYLQGEPPPVVVSVILVVLLAIALIAADVDRGGLVAVFARDGVGGKAARWFVLFALVVPLGIELLRAWLVRIDALGASVAATLSVAFSTMILISICIVGARRLDRYEQALRMARQAVFMSVLSHELRSPLIAMRNLSDVVEEGWGDLDDAQKRLVLRTTSQEASRMLRMVHEASQLSALDAGELEARPAAVVLRDSLLAAGKALGREVVVQCPERLTAYVDPEHLRLMLDACVSRVADDSRDAALRISATVDGQDAHVYIDLPIRLAASTTSAAADRRADERRIGGLRAVAALARLSGGEARYERRDKDTSRYVLTLPLAVDPKTEFRA